MTCRSQSLPGLTWPVFAAFVLGACASIPPDVRTIPPTDQGQVELTGTPFFPQERFQCGPAALATVLSASGVAARPEELVDTVYVPERRGSLQIEMIAAARAANRIPYRIDGSMSAVLAELQAGRPVLILQNLGTKWLSRWHYAVVVGIDADRQRVILRSGLNARRLTDVDLFLRTWQRSDYWGFVLLAPGELPAAPAADRYFNAVADLESTGHVDAAAAGWAAAVERWPDNPVALFGLANAKLSTGDPAGAAALYRQILVRNRENLLARNNLAYALADLGRKAEALDLLREAIAAADGEPAATAMLEDSLAEISSRP